MEAPTNDAPDFAAIVAASPFRTLYSPLGAVRDDCGEAFVWRHRHHVAPEDVAYLAAAIPTALKAGRVFYLLFSHKKPRDRLKRDLRAMGIRFASQGVLQ